MAIFRQVPAHADSMGPFNLLHEPPSTRSLVTSSRTKERMIGLVRLLPPSTGADGTRSFPDLPGPPADSFSGFMVRCDSIIELTTTLAWFKEICRKRPYVSLGLVCRPEVCFSSLGKWPRPVQPVLSPAELLAGRIPLAAFDELRRSSIEGRIMEELVSVQGLPILAEQSLLRTLIARAVCGGTLNSVSTEMRMSSENIRLKMGKMGVKPGRLMSWARIRAYELSVQMGAASHEALLACGWYSQEARRKCVRRFKQEHDR